jgi:hypothetical protein
MAFIHKNIAMAALVYVTKLYPTSLHSHIECCGWDFSTTLFSMKLNIGLLRKSSFKERVMFLSLWLDGRGLKSNGIVDDKLQPIH